MECFNNVLLKLREIHEREVEGWQGKIQELSNKKGCDTKRMEELFTKNQQMKEQQRVLIENIKTLENRLRAGLCDRCTVTQEVAKRRQMEFEASQIQSLQHISLLAGEMTNMKKENKRLRDELRNLRAALEAHSDHSSNRSNTPDVKPTSPPEYSPSSGPEALLAMGTSRAGNQPAGVNVALKTEANQRTEENVHRQLRGMNGSQFESYKPLSWKTEQNVTCVMERRAQSVEELDQRSSIPPQALLKNFYSSTGGEGTPTRHVVHAPVPCRPQPTRISPATVPWPFSESSDLVTPAAPATSPVVQPSSKPYLPRSPNLIPTSQHSSSRSQVSASPWHKQSTPQPPAKEPTVVFRLRSLSDRDVECQTKPQEKKDIPPLKTERVSGDLKEAFDGPLDLSDHGKSKSSHTPTDNSPLALQTGERVRSFPDKDGKENPLGPVSSLSPVVPPSCPSVPPVNQQEEGSASDRNHKQVIKDWEQKKEENGKTDQNGNGKKVPVLTISLRPVVALETLNSALQKSLLSHGKSSLSAAEPRSSSDEQDEDESVSGQENSQGCKRKRASVETETDRDSETDHIQQEKKIQITLRTEGKSPG
ncbi:RBBP8 N-terminal-like protein isoform X3 [Etheostoma spectabile]|uniref:RBBP8 N-terminal-like protein isoform X3 n=1 Tax=Etheostoma spectabile TaxID=54343 RepID=UPI0013AEE5C2|nr:RBBP8 N-terminal-like protein isoform X3 [Etheostoma spectabile]